jgi:hypothetical protein
MSGAELYQSASLADSSSKFLSLVSHLVIRTSGDSPSVGIQASGLATGAGAKSSKRGITPA